MVWILVTVARKTFLWEEETLGGTRLSRGGGSSSWGLQDLLLLLATGSAHCPAVPGHGLPPSSSRCAGKIAGSQPLCSPSPCSETERDNAYLAPCPVVGPLATLSPWCVWPQSACGGADLVPSSSFSFGFSLKDSPQRISVHRFDSHVWFGKSFTSDALPDTTLCIYPGLGPAQ